MAGKKDADLNDDLSGLSPEEIAALSDGDEDDIVDDPAGAEDEDDNDGEEADSEDADDQDDDAEEADAEEADAEEAEDGDDEEDSEDEAPAVRTQFQPDLAVQPVENFDQQMADFATAKEALRTELTNGDIELEEYERRKDEITDKITDLRLQQNNYENEVARRKNEGQQRWQWEQDVFFGRKENEIYKANKALGSAFNTTVIDLASDPVNANQTGTWFLEEADRQVRALFQGVKQPEPVDLKGAKQKERKPNLKNLPPSLKDIPPAAETETGDTEFSYLDKLTGADLERELAKISKDPAKESRYLRS